MCCLISLHIIKTRPKTAKKMQFFKDSVFPGEDLQPPPKTPLMQLSPHFYCSIVGNSAGDCRLHRHTCPFSDTLTVLPTVHHYPTPSEGSIAFSLFLFQYYSNQIMPQDYKIFNNFQPSLRCNLLLMSMYIIKNVPLCL